MKAIALQDGRYSQEKMELFCSYAREDKPLVQPIVDELEKYCDCWIDYDDLSGGVDWGKGIRSGIFSCDRFLFFVSCYSLQSEWCMSELRLAVWLKKPIIPIVFDPKIKLPRALSRKQWVVFGEFNEGIKLILASLSSHTPWKEIAIAQFLCIFVLVLLLLLTLYPFQKNF